MTSGLQPTPPTRAAGGVRVALAVATATTILTGQSITHGALYGHAFLSLPFAYVLAMKRTFDLTAGTATLLVSSGGILTILCMMLVFAGLLLSLACSIYIAASRAQPRKTTRFTSNLLGGLAVFICAGLASTNWLRNQPDFKGQIQVQPYFYLWPALFLVLAFLYAALHRKTARSESDPVSTAPR